MMSVELQMIPKPTQEQRKIHASISGGSTDWLRALNKDVKKSNYKRTEEAIKRDEARHKVSAMADFRQFSDSVKEVWEE